MEAIGCAYLDFCYVKSGHHDEGDETKCGSDCEFKLFLLNVCCAFRVFENEKHEPTHTKFRKTKSRALQLHFGTSLSIRLQIVFENGTLEVEHHDFALAQMWKCLTWHG